MDSDTLIQMLNTIMEYHAWNQNELARRFKVSCSQVSRWLAGAQKINVDNYIALKKLYDAIPEKMK